jgi:tetratricopeptide (TPR) repeat protein
MAREWENPGYRKRKKEAVLLVLLLAVSIGWFLFRPPRANPPLTQNRRHAVPDGKAIPDPKPPAAEKSSAPESAGNTVPSSIETSVREEDDSLRRANRAFAAGDYAEAARLFQELAAKEGRYRTYAGVAFFRMKEYEPAIRQLEQAVAADPSDFQAHKFLALAWYLSDRLEESLEHARAGLALRADGELEALLAKLEREKPVQDEYVDAEIPNFRILFDGREQREAKRLVIRFLKEAYADIGKKLDLFPAGLVTVILYSERDFAAATGAPFWIGGLYDGKIRIPVRGVIGREAALKRILFHEYTHALIYSVTPACPRWIHEGLAEYCSGSRPPRIGQIIPLERLENASAWWNGESAPLAYRESHAAVAALIDRFGLDRLKQFLLALGRDETLPEAFQGAFYMPYSRFLAQWGRPAK